MRWFHNPILSEQKIECNEVEVTRHLMPYLRRSLTYIKHQQKAFPKQKNTIFRDHIKSKDLLWKIFRHRTIRYNKALLASPRTTRVDDQDHEFRNTNVTRPNDTNSKLRKKKSCKRKIDLISMKNTPDKDDKDQRTKRSTNNENEAMKALVLSEKRALAFGKRFPKYNPMDENTGVSNSPKKPKDAFSLFCEAHYQKSREKLSHGKQNRRKVSSRICRM